MYLIGAISFSGIREKLHSRNLPVVLHIRVTLSPIHTDAIPGGEITALPIIQSWHVYNILLMLNSANCPSYAFTTYTEGKNQLQLYFMAYPNQVYDMIHLYPFLCYRLYISEYNIIMLHRLLFKHMTFQPIVLKSDVQFVHSSYLL